MVVTFPEPEQAPDQAYDVIGDPPVLFGDQFHVSWPEADLVGVETVGEAGTVDGTTGAVGAEFGPWPLAFTAAMVKV